MLTASIGLRRRRMARVHLREMTSGEGEIEIEAFFLIVLTMFGLVFGSFANVVIWRFPRGESLSHPDSHCPVCETPILRRDNIPVLSWLLLHGQCRSCGVAISPRYPIVELMSGVLWLLAGVRFGMSLQTGLAVAFFYLLLILTWIDIDIMRLPNALVGLLAAIGLAGAAVGQFAGIAGTPLIGESVLTVTSPLLMAALGAVVCAVPALLLSVLGAVVLKRPALGMGDVKLLAVIGLFLGGYGLLAFFVGSAIGTVYGVFAIVRARSDENARSVVSESASVTITSAVVNADAAETAGLIVSEADSGTGSDDSAVDLPATSAAFPFGPALAAGAVIVTLVGPQLWGWYQSLFVM
jgi:leader peptidase (prepilin peptidase) / N-methyltransferase